MYYICLHVQSLNKPIECGNFFDQRRGHQLEPDLSEEVSARLRLGSGSNGLFRRKMSILETKEKNYSRIKHLIRPKNIREIKASFYYLQHHYAII